MLTTNITAANAPTQLVEAAMESVMRIAASAMRGTCRWS